MINDIEVGRILKPQGLKGEVKVACISNDIERLIQYKFFYTQNRSNKLIVKSARSRLDFAYFCFENITSVEMAETLRNEILYVDVSQLPKLQKNTWYEKDLINSKVIDENGKELGIIVSIDDFGATKNINILSADKKEGIFPFLEDLIVDIDIDNKVFVVNAKRFDEVCVYED